MQLPYASMTTEVVDQTTIKAELARRRGAMEIVSGFSTLRGAWHFYRNAPGTECVQVELAPPTEIVCHDSKDGLMSARQDDARFGFSGEGEGCDCY